MFSSPTTKITWRKDRNGVLFREKRAQGGTYTYHLAISDASSPSNTGGNYTIPISASWQQLHDDIKSHLPWWAKISDDMARELTNQIFPGLAAARRAASRSAPSTVPVGTTRNNGRQVWNGKSWEPNPNLGQTSSTSQSAIPVGTTRGGGKLVWNGSSWVPNPNYAPGTSVPPPPPPPAYTPSPYTPAPPPPPAYTPSPYTPAPPPYGYTPYAPYAASPYGPSPYAPSPYGAYGASPYGASPYGASPYGPSMLPAPQYMSPNPYMPAPSFTYFGSPAPLPVPAPMQMSMPMGAQGLDPALLAALLGGQDMPGALVGGLDDGSGGYVDPRSDYS